MNALETIKISKGIKSIEISKGAATMKETGEKMDFVEIHYYAKGNYNIANVQGLITDPHITEILEYHNSLPKFRQVRIISR